jgi:hypothetical protein
LKKRLFFCLKVRFLNQKRTFKQLITGVGEKSNWFEQAIYAISAPVFAKNRISKKAGGASGGRQPAAGEFQKADAFVA